MQIRDAAQKKALKRRLCRAAGQLHGVADMIERDADCAEIATQLSACRSAIQHALGAFTTCAIEAAKNDARSEKKQDEEIGALLKLVM